MKLNSLYIDIFILSTIVCGCLSQFLTSSFHLERLLRIEETMVKKLLVYIDRQKVNNNITFDDSIVRFIESVHHENQQNLARTRDLDTPLSGYHVLQRLVTHWAELREKMSCTDEITCPLVTGEDLIHNVLKKETELPTDDDVQTAALAIINVWNVYALYLDDVINGTFPDAEDKSLSADDIFYIADAAKQAGKLYEAVTWFKYLAGKLDQFFTRDFQDATLYQRLAASYHEFGATSKAVTVLEEYLKSDPDNTRISRDLMFFKQRAKGSNVSEVLRFAKDDTSEITEQRKQYERLCQTAAKDKYPASRLRCRLLPLLNYYGKVKVEALSRRPKIQRFYDVVNTTGAMTWRNYSKLTFGQLSNRFPLWEYSQSSPQATRSGAMCEGNVHLFPLLRNVTARLEQITGFQLHQQRHVASSLCYQMSNEGNGGYQKLVTDYRSQEQMTDPATPFLSAGNKLATIILQLSDVAYGGDIVFPRADLYVPVVKGSAVVVWNIRENGKIDPRSARVNCPVVVGTKWTAVKHVFYNNQAFRRPCAAKI